MGAVYDLYKADMENVKRMKALLKSADRVLNSIKGYYSDVRNSYERISAGFLDLDLTRDVPLRSTYTWYGADRDAYAQKVEDLYKELRDTYDLLKQAFNDIKANIDDERIMSGRNASAMLEQFDELDWLQAAIDGYA